MFSLDDNIRYLTEGENSILDDVIDKMKCSYSKLRNFSNTNTLNVFSQNDLNYITVIFTNLKEVITTLSNTIKVEAFNDKFLKSPNFKKYKNSFDTVNIAFISLQKQKPSNDDKSNNTSLMYKIQQSFISDKDLNKLFDKLNNGQIALYGYIMKLIKILNSIYNYFTVRLKNV